MSQLRLPYFKLSADAFAGFLQAAAALDKGSTDAALRELLYFRVSQINGCAYCLHMHAKGMREHGASQDKIDTVAGWPLSPHFDDAERAALAYAESITAVADTRVPEDVYLPLKTHFTDEQISDLTVAISLINAFNRIAVAMKR
ncbi:MAG: carboxymuconolactone decarboxylase family protein [Alphaproteobacteria bacterium]|nr:carboxymuconolactone decarboxylase family protein [Alphaproteobacteria bacterium]